MLLTDADSGQLASCQPPIDLIVCDEGHRLKTKDNKTTKMFEALRTTRRISQFRILIHTSKLTLVVLSGTPVQNDLGEYWSMASHTHPKFRYLTNAPGGLLLPGIAWHV